MAFFDMSRSTFISMAAVLVLGAGFAAPLSAAEPSSSAPFSQWLEGVRKEASAAGISGNFFDVALAGVQPIKRVMELDRRQPEFRLTVWK